MLTTFQIILLALIGFLILTYLANILNLQRFGIHILPIGIMFKTEFFNKILIKMGDNWKRFWKLLYDVGKVLVGIIFIGLLGFFIVNPFLIIFNSPVSLGIQLIIPGVTIDFKVALLFIFPIIMVLIPHEIAHAVMARREGIDIKSSGVFLFFVFFGGFVELTREHMEKAKLKSKIRVLLNGSAINAIFAVIFGIIFLLSPAIISIGYNSPDGIMITKIYEDFPADNAGIIKGDVIVKIGKYNGSLNRVEYSEIQTVNDYYRMMIESVDADVLYIRLVDNTIRFVKPTNTNPISGENSTTTIFLGLSIYNYHPPKSQRQGIWFPYYWNIQVQYTLNICIMAVFINILPLVVTDGDKILNAYLKNKFKENSKHKRILNTIRILSLAIMVANIVLSMI